MASSPGAAKAIEDGQVLLRKFSASKSRRNSGTRLDAGDLNVLSSREDHTAYNDALFGDDSDDFDQPSFDHAVAEGSLVAQLYSDKKRNTPGAYTPSSVLDSDQTRSEEVMLVLRQALQEAQDLEHKVNSQEQKRQSGLNDSPSAVQEGLPMIVRLLQDLEGHLEAETAPISKKIIFSPSSSRGSTAATSTPVTNDRVKSSASPGSDTKQVLKVYMKNQLDLQESEWEAYEETFNNIAEQLDDARQEVEVVTAERDALLAQQSEWKGAADASSDSGYEQQFFTLQEEFELQRQRVVELETQLDTERSAATAEHSQLKTMLESYTTTITTLNESLEVEAAKVRQLEESLQTQHQNLQQAITSPALLRHTPLKSKSSSVKQKVEEYENHVLNLNSSNPSTPSSSDKGVLQNYMQNQLELQEHEWADYEDMVNAVAEKLEETELSLEKCQTENEELCTLKTELQAEIERLQLLLSQKTAAFEASEDSIREDNKQRLSDLRVEFKAEVATLESIIVGLKSECVTKEDTIRENQNRFDESLKVKQEELHDMQNLLQSDISRLEMELQDTTNLLSDKTNQYLMLQEESRAELLAMADDLNELRASAASAAASAAAAIASAEEDHSSIDADMVDNLRNQIDDLTTDQEMSEVERKLLIQEKDELQRQIASLQADVSQARVRWEEQCVAYMEISQDNERKVSEMAILDTRVEELEAEITEVTASLFSSQNQVNVLQNDLLVSVGQRDKSMVELELIRKQFHDEVDQNNKLENELDQLRIKLENSRASSPLLPENDQESQDALVNELKDVITTLENDKTVLQQQMEELLFDKNISEERMKENMTLVNKQVQTLKGMLAEKEEIITQKEKLLSDRDTLIGEREDLLAEKSVQVQHEMQRSAQLNETVHELSHQIETLNDLIHKSQGESSLDDLNCQILNLNGQIEELKSTMQSKDELLAADADTIDVLKQRVSELELQASSTEVTTSAAPAADVSTSSLPVPSPINTGMQSYHLETIARLENSVQMLNDNLVSKDAIILRMKSLFAQSLDPMGDVNFYGDTNFTQTDADVVQRSPTSRGTSPRSLASSPRNSPSKVSSLVPTDTESGAGAGTSLQHSMSINGENYDATLASLDDAERVIQAMEKKLRVQIHHLQSLQDTLSEEKRKSAYLADHKRQLLQKLKDMENQVHQLEDELQQNKLQHVDMTHREASTQRTLEEERAKAKVLETQLLDCKVQLSTNLALIEDLQSNNSKLRAEVEDRHLTTFNSIEFQQEAKNEADTIQLTTQYNSIQQALSELEAVNVALKANLEHKTVYASDLVAEVNTLRSLVTSKDDALEALRASDLKVEANLQAQLLEKERIIDRLNQIISRLEEHKTESELLLAERLQKLQNEQEVNSQLRTFLTIIDEKESTTEELLYQIQMSESSMASQLNETSNLFVAEKESSKQVLSDMALLRNEMEIQKAEYEQFKSFVEMEKQTAEDNKRILQSQLEASDAMIAEKNVTIESLRAQNLELQEEIASWERKVSTAERSRRGDIDFKNDFKRSVANIVEEFTYAVKRQDQTAQNLESSVVEWLDMYEDRIIYLAKDAARLKDQLPNHKQVQMELQSEKDQHTFEVARIETTAKQERTALETRFNLLQHENESLRDRLSQVEQARQALTEQLRDTPAKHDPSTTASPQHSARQQMHSHSRHHGHGHGQDQSIGWQDLLEHDRTMIKQAAHHSNSHGHSFDNIDNESVGGRSVGSHSHTHSLTEDFSRLTEKFELTEKRALEMSAQGARYYAKTSKGMALLEGENAKLRSLIDHFRIVNAKLMGDVYAATSASAEAGGLKHRFDILESQYLKTLEKVSELENDIMSKEQQLASCIEEHQLQMEKKMEDHDEIIRDEHAKFRVVEESLTYAEKTISQTQEMNQLLEKRIEREIQIAADESERLTALLNTERKNLADSEHLVSVLQEAVVELEIEQGNLKSAMALQASHHAEALAAQEDSRKSLQGSEESKNSRVRSLEAQVEELKQQRLLDSNMLADQDNRIASLSDTCRFAEDELQDKLKQLEEMEQKVQELTHTTSQQADKINDLVLYLEEAREQANISADESSASASKILKVEEKLRQVSNSKKSLEQTVEELTIQKDAALDSLTLNEQRREELDADLTQARQDIEALNAEILDTNADFNVMKISYDAREREIAAKEGDIVALNKEIADLKLKCDRLAEVEAQILSQQEDLNGIEHVESHLVMDMQAVITRLESVLGSERLGGGGDDNHLTRSRSGSGGEDIRSPMGDLLYTPLKTLLTPSRGLIGAVQMNPPHFSEYNQHDQHQKVHDGSHSDSVSNAHLTRLRNHFHRLIQMADEHLYRSARLEDSSRTMTKRMSELDERFETLDQKHRMIISEKATLQQRLQANENEIESLEEELECVREERDNAVHAGEDHAQWLRLLRRDLESSYAHEAIPSVLRAAKAHSDKQQLHLPPVQASARGSPMKGFTELSVSMIEYGQDYPLKDSVAEVKSTLLSLVQALNTSSNILTQKEAILVKQDQEINDLKTLFSQEKISLTDQINNLMDLLKQEKSKSQKISEELNVFLAENDNLKAQLHDQQQIRNELEDENMTVKDSIKDLRQALKDAEVLCVDLRSKIRQLSTDKDHLHEDMTLAREEVSISLRRISDLELHLEQNGLSLSRVKAERDTLSNIKMQLTHELEVARREAAAAASRDSKPMMSNEDIKATFELERLLAALGATLDHLHSTMETKLIQEGFSEKFDNSFEEEKSTASNKDTDSSQAVTVTLSHRVEEAVKRLSSVRTWSRDERRHKRLVEENLNQLRTELERQKCKHSQESAENLETIRALQAKEHHLLLQTTTLSSVKAQNQEYDQAMTALKKERDELLATISTNKHALAANTLTIQAHELDISKLKHSLDSEKEQIGDLKDSVMQLQSEVEARQTLCDEQDATIRGLKAAAQRQKDAMDRLETLVSRHKKEKEEMDKKNKYKSDGKESESLETMQKIRALEVELRESKQSYRKELSSMQERLHSETSENATALTSLVAMEEKLQAVTAESASQRKQLLANSQELDRLRARLDKEIQEHKSTLASLSTVQALEADWRQTAEDCQVMREEADAKLEKTLDQLDEMQQELASETDAKITAQQLLVTTRTEANRLKQSVDQLSLQLERSQREAQSASSRGSALRREGRQIHAEVLAAVKELKEVTSVLHSLTNMDIDCVDDSNTDAHAGDEETKDQSHDLILGETLGAKQLHSSIQVIHQYITKIRKFPQEISNTHSALRACELENARLQRELETIDTLHADRVQRLHNELQNLENQLQDRTSYDVTQESSYSRQLRELQTELNRVRERAQAREEQFKEEVQLLTSEKMRIEGFQERSDVSRSRSNSVELLSSSTSHRSSADQALEIESLTSQLRSAHKEIEAIRHHRSVLQGTVSELETLVYQEPSPNKPGLQSTLRLTGVDGTGSMESAPLDNAAEYVESLSADVSKLNRRLAGAEKVCTIYRTALLALYIDGSFFDSLPVNTGLRDTDSEGHPLGLGWIEKDVSIITAAYVEEMHELQKEVLDWQFQVKQGDTYRTELRARLEDTLKALYRAGKGESSSMLAHQLEHLSKDLQQSSEQIAHLTQKLSEAQGHRHRRVDQLTEELVRVQQARDDFMKETALKDRQTQRQMQAQKAETEALQTKFQNALHDLQTCNQSAAQQRQHLQEQTRVISNLRQELIRSDNQLETVKRQVKQQRAAATNTATTATTTTTAITTSTAGATANTTATRLQVSLREQSDTHSSSKRASSTFTDTVSRHPPTPPRLRYGRGLDDSIDSLGPSRAYSSTATATPPRASSTSRVSKARTTQPQNHTTAAASTPERTTRQNRGGNSSTLSSPPAVVRVRTSHAQVAGGGLSSTPPSRRRPSLESISSNSSEKLASYSSTRNISSNSRR